METGRSGDCFHQNGALGWRSALGGLGASLAAIDDGLLRSLGEDTRAAHLAWDAAGRP